MNKKLDKKLNVAVIIGIIALTGFLSSCATKHEAFVDIDQAVADYDFETAKNLINKGQEPKKNAKRLYKDKNQISLYLDKGMLEFYDNNYEGSTSDLQTAERMIEEAYTKSVGQKFLSYIANDNTIEYPGEDFEDIYLNIFNAISYYHKGDLESALVEIRKLSISSGKLDMLARKYNYVDPETGESLNESVAKETDGLNMDLGDNEKATSFSNSALARYLGALLYNAAGNKDAARIEYDQVGVAFRTNAALYPHALPQTVAQTRNTPDATTRLNIISFTGLSPIKIEHSIPVNFPLRQPRLRTAELKVPVLMDRENRVNRVEVIVNGNTVNLELLEDMGIVIKDTFNNRFTSILRKAYIRVFIKYFVSDVAARVAEQRSAAAAALVALAAEKAIEASEAADIRMARFLPNKAFIGGINLQPGTYSVTINYYNGPALVSTQEIEEVTVKANQLNLLQSTSLK